MKFFLNIFFLVFLIIFTISTNVNAQSQSSKKRGGTKALKGGSYSIGLGVGFGSIEQDGLNDSISASKTISLATTGNLNSSIEYMGFFTFRFANNYVALQLRPSYFTQSSHGSGPAGNYDYDLTGFTVFPIIRFIPLSNDIIDFYIQGGLGYGKLDGKITNDSRFAGFSGSGFGTQIGLGADFCFFPAHCLGVEGNYRYLPIVRNVVTSASGGLPNGMSQSAANKELENINGDDVPTKMSGVIGAITYTFNF